MLVVISRVSCSHVGHIYRGPRRRSMHPRGGNQYQSHINHLRVAEVNRWWTDGRILLALTWSRFGWMSTSNITWPDSRIMVISTLVTPVNTKHYERVWTARALNGFWITLPMRWPRNIRCHPLILSGVKCATKRIQNGAPMSWAISMVDPLVSPGVIILVEINYFASMSRESGPLESIVSSLKVTQSSLGKRETKVVIEDERLYMPLLLDG